MNRDDEPYLWDQSGEPDPLVRELEQQLLAFRHRGEAPPAAPAGEPPALLAAAAPTSIARSERFGRAGAWRLAAAAAAVTVTVVGGWWLAPASEGRSGWQVEALAGSPLLAGREPTAGARLRAGDTLETGDGERARLRLPAIGEVELAPGGRLRLLPTARGAARLALDRGALLATIVSPPRVFQVQTPRGTAVDLGCMFTLEVLPDGGERLRVEAGWVALLVGGREAFVPRGAVLDTPPGRPLGVPVRLDAAPAFRNAIREHSRAPATAEGDGALAGALALASRDDAFTLWHLLSATSGNDRQAVAARLAALVPPPATVTSEGIAAGDQLQLDAWWEALGLGGPAWWREWRVAAGAADGGALPAR